jgi:predicted Zn-dependent peptidase
MNNFETKIFSSELLGESYTRYTHASGLEIYIFPKKMSATYALFGVKYGSLNSTFKRDGESITVPDGIAHFLEHKLFFNEDGSDSFERFSDLGADANAYTSFNKTAYLFSCTENFHASFDELLTFVTHPYFTPESVASEIGIISEEIKMYDDSPFDRCFYGMLEGMYESHSVKRNICGSERSIREITDKTLYDCYHTFYRPDNMVIAICGNVDTDEVLDAVERIIPVRERGARAVCENENAREPKGAHKQLVEQYMQVSKPIFNIGYKDTDIPADAVGRVRKEAVLSILDEMIFSRAGELYTSLFDKKLISPALSYGYTICSDFAYNSVAGEADDPAAVQNEISEFISELRIKGLDRQDFERAKKVMYAESIKCFDSVESIANNLFSAVCEGAELFSYTDVIGEVRFEDVCEAFERSFDKDTLTLSVIYPIK